LQKVTLPERPNWRDNAQEVGFSFADMHGEPYWDIRMHTSKGSTPQLDDPLSVDRPAVAGTQKKGLRSSFLTTAADPLCTFPKVLIVITIHFQP